MKKILVRIVIVIAVLMVIGLVAVFFSLNSIVKKGVETVGPMITKVDVKLGSAAISPFSGGGELSKLLVGNPEPYKAPSSIQVGDIKVSVGIRSLTTDTILVNEVNVQDAEITLEGSLTGNNLTKLLDNINGTSSSENKGAAPAAVPGKSAKKFIVKDLVVEGAKVHLSLDVAISHLSLTVPLPPLHLQNIGEAENGVTASQLVQAVMKPLLASVLQAATDEVAKAGLNAAKLGKGAAGEVGKATKGITDLFKKQ